MTVSTAEQLRQQRIARDRFMGSYVETTRNVFDRLTNNPSRSKKQRRNIDTYLNWRRGDSPAVRAARGTVGRNEACGCGSGRKNKHCCAK